MCKESALIFQGSKERLKRNVVKLGGNFREDQYFELVWRSKYFRRGLAFRFRCRYEKVGAAYRITYTYAPAMGMLLWIMLLTVGLLLFAAQECADGYYESALSVSLFSMLYPGIAIWQGYSCRKEFRKAFSAVTGKRYKEQLRD